MWMLLACFSSTPDPAPAADPTPLMEAVTQAVDAPDPATSPDASDAPSTTTLDLTRLEPFASGEGSVPVPVEDRLSAIKRTCMRLEDCGCNDDQPFERCVQSAHGTTLPDTVYRCIASRPCEALCAANKQGTADKGLTDCVQPYIEETIGSKGSGLKKRK